MQSCQVFWILLLNVDLYTSNIYIFLQVGNIKVTAKQGLKILSIHCQNSTLIITNGIRKVRLAVDIIDKRILNSCKYILDSALEYGLVYIKSFPCGQQSINRYHSAWCTAYQDSTFNVSIFLFSGKR